MPPAYDAIMTVLVTHHADGSVTARGVSEDEDRFRLTFPTIDILMRQMVNHFHQKPWHADGKRYRCILNIPPLSKRGT